MTDKGLTVQQEAFAHIMARGGVSASAAYAHIYGAGPRTSASAGSKALNKPHVAARIAEIRAALARGESYTPPEGLRELPPVGSVPDGTAPPPARRERERVLPDLLPNEEAPGALERVGLTLDFVARGFAAVAERAAQAHDYKSATVALQSIKAMIAEEVDPDNASPAVEPAKIAIDDMLRVMDRLLGQPGETARDVTPEGARQRRALAQADQSDD